MPVTAGWRSGSWPQARATGLDALKGLRGGTRLLDHADEAADALKSVGAALRGLPPGMGDNLLKNPALRATFGTNPALLEQAVRNPNLLDAVASGTRSLDEVASSEVELENGHEWKQREDGAWCRCSHQTDLCVGANGKPIRDPNDQPIRSGQSIATDPLSPEAIAVIRSLRGGQDLRDKIASKEVAHQGDHIQEARVALEALQRDEVIEHLDKPLAQAGDAPQELTEIDVETLREMIQVKGGDYSKAKKLSDQDMRQMTATLRYRDRRANPKHPRTDPDGTVLPTREKEVVFWFATPNVNPELIKWLSNKGVIPRIGL